jgi:hypothetical protein
MARFAAIARLDAATVLLRWETTMERRSDAPS